MTLIAQNWYDLNSGRRYPLDDSVTAIDDAGNKLPADILVDAYLRFPSTVGRYAYISSVHVSANLISLTLLASFRPAKEANCASESLSATQETQFVPLAVVSIARNSFKPFRQYPLEALYPGVGGWVVLGDVRSTLAYGGTFATVEQSMLLPRLCRAYEPLPIPNVAKLNNATILTGLVTVLGGVDVSVTKEVRTIEGVDQDALVIALVAAPSRNVLDIYRGPCSSRPESGTCNQPGIETINSVTPDCTGNITISVVSDCADIVKTDSHGLLVDYCLGLADVCTDQDHLPKDGKLPNDYDDYCRTRNLEWRSTDIGDAVAITYGAHWGTRSYSSSSSIAMPCVELPYVDTFQDGGADYFIVKSGEFHTADGAYKATLSGHHNLTIWDGCLLQNLLAYRISTEAIIPLNGGRPNAGLVFDWRPDGTYYVVEIDKASDSFRLRFYTGHNFVTMVQRPRMAVTFDTTYAILCDFTEHDTYVQVFCRLRAEHFGGDTIAEFTANLPRLKQPGGYIGLHAYLSEAVFPRFAVGEIETAESHSSTVLSSHGTAGSFSLSSGTLCTLPLDHLLALWRLEESGNATRIDAIAGLNMTPSAAMDTVLGPHETHGVAITNGNYLTTIADDSLSLGMHPLTVAFWVKFNTVPTEPTIICGKHTGPELEWLVFADTDGIHGVVSPNGITHVRVDPNNDQLGDLVADKWYHVVLWYSRDDKSLYMEIDNQYRGQQDYDDTIYISSVPVAIARPGIDWLPGVLDGAVDDLAIFDLALTREERACLYLYGIATSEIAAIVSGSVSQVPVPGPVAFWSLNEAGSTDERLDQFGVYHLKTVSSDGAIFKSGLLDGAVSFSKFRTGLRRDHAAGIGQLSPGFTDFSFGGWIYGSYATLSEQCLGGIWGISPDDREYAIFMTPTGYKACVSANGVDATSSEYNEIEHNGNRTAGWRHVMLVFDATSGTVRVYFNGQPAATSDIVTTVNQGDSPFALGCSSWLKGTTQKYGQAVPLTFDDWGFWTKALQDYEVDAIYNNGQGWQP